MRHKVKDNKLGRSSSHREATIAAIVCGLVKRGRVKTTLAKARQARSSAEKMVTLASKAGTHQRRLIISRLKDAECASKLIEEIAPRYKERNGGYTRILKTGRRSSDGSEMAYLEWVESAALDDSALAGVDAESKKK